MLASPLTKIKPRHLLIKALGARVLDLPVDERIICSQTLEKNN